MNQLYLGMDRESMISTVMENLDEAKKYSRDKVFIVDMNGDFPEIEGSKTISKYSGEVINPVDLLNNATPGDRIDVITEIVEVLTGKGKKYLTLINRICEKICKNKASSFTLREFFEALENDNTPESNALIYEIEPFCIGRYDKYSHQTSLTSAFTVKKLVVFKLLNEPENLKGLSLYTYLKYIDFYCGTTEETVRVFVTYDGRFTEVHNNILLKIIKNKDCSVSILSLRSSDLLNTTTGAAVLNSINSYKAFSPLKDDMLKKYATKRKVK